MAYTVTWQTRSQLLVEPSNTIKWRVVQEIWEILVALWITDRSVSLHSNHSYLCIFKLFQPNQRPYQMTLGRIQYGIEIPCIRPVLHTGTERISVINSPKLCFWFLLKRLPLFYYFSIKESFDTQNQTFSTKNSHFIFNY